MVESIFRIIFSIFFFCSVNSSVAWGQQSMGSDSSIVDAARYGDVSEVKSLIRAGVDVNALNDYGESALMHAAYSSNEALVDILVNAGADVNMTNEAGNTALMFAAQKGNVFITEMLVAHGADVGMANADGFRAAELARKSGFLRVADIINEPVTSAASASVFGRLLEAF